MEDEGERERDASKQRVGDENGLSPGEQNGGSRGREAKSGEEG